MQGLWIWTLFSCLTKLHWVNRDKCAYGINLNSNLEWICKWLCNALLFNGIANTLQPGTSHYNLDHVIVHLHLYWSYVCHVYPDRSGAGIGGQPLCWRHRYRTSSARQATPPLIMLIKTHFPLSLSYALIRMITLLSFLPHSWTHIRCMTYHLVTVVSKPQS